MSVELILSDAQGSTKAEVKDWPTAVWMIMERSRHSQSPLLAATILEMDAPGAFGTTPDNIIRFPDPRR